MDVPRVPQQARSRQKRDLILSAAAQLFAQRGYDATTADDIAEEAGVSVGTFYSYFRNKRQVFLALYVTVLESVEALGISNIDFSVEPRQALRELVKRSLTRSPLYYGLHSAWAELAARDPELNALSERFTETLYQQILTAVRRVVVQGMAWRDLDAEEASCAITLLLDQKCPNKLRKTLGLPEEMARHQEALADMIYHTIFHGGPGDHVAGA